jgi:uncharacterized membrane protein YozB (DUF420 family)
LGFLGNSAPYPPDLNLITQIVVLGLLLAGASLARVSEFKLHGRLMLSAIGFQFVAVFSWMLPSVLRNIGALALGGVGPAITLMHVYFGVYALCLAIAAARHWKLEKELKWTMRLIFSAWILVAILGMLFYVHYYLGLL